MKERLQGLIAGFLIGVMLTSGMVFAKNKTEIIEAFYNNIKIYVDGVKIEPKDAAGNVVEPFIYNGTTYLPVRAVGEAIGKKVTWEGETQSVFLGDKPGEVLNLFDVCTPYAGEWFEVKNAEAITIAGKKYYNTLTLGNIGNGVTGFALFNLDSKYDKLSFEIGAIDERSYTGTIKTLNLYTDNKLINSYEISASSLPQKIIVDLKSACQLKIELVGGYGQSGEFGIINAILE